MKKLAAITVLALVGAGCTGSPEASSRSPAGSPSPPAETASPSSPEPSPNPRAEDHIVWVAVEDERRVVAVDVRARKLIRRFPVSGGPHNITVARDGTVAVSLPDVGRIALIRGGRLREVDLGGSPHDVKPWGAFVVVANEGASLIQVVSTRGRIVRAIPLRAEPHDLAPSDRDTTVWASLNGRDELAAVEPGGGSEPRYVATGESPHDLLFGPNRGGLWVTDWDGDVHVFSARGRLLQTLRLGREAHHLAFRPDGSQVWITDHDARRVFVVDTEDRRLLDSFALKGAPHHVAMTSGGTRAVVADHERGSVLIFDAERLRRVGRIPVGAGPHGIWAAS
jgi:DNA-binding beta-propeller fold protein YncE